jgi:hypothetical protein
LFREKNLFIALIQGDSHKEIYRLRAQAYTARRICWVLLISPRESAAAAGKLLRGGHKSAVTASQSWNRLPLNIFVVLLFSDQSPENSHRISLMKGRVRSSFLGVRVYRLAFPDEVLPREAFLVPVENVQPVWVNLLESSAARRGETRGLFLVACWQTQITHPVRTAQARQA